MILLAALTRLRLSALLSRLLAALTGLLTGLLLTTAALLATLTATTLVLLVGPLFVWHDFTPCMAARRDTNKSGDAMFRWRWRSLSSIGRLPHRRDARSRRAQLAPARLLEKTPPRDEPSVGAMQFALQSRQAMLAARAYTNPQAGGTSGIFLAGLFERPGIAGASTAAPFSGARVTAITESSKHHRSVNPPTLQPRPIIGGERHGA